METEEHLAKPEIVGISATTSIGGDWASTWQALLNGRSASTSFNSFGSEFVLDVPVSGVIDLDRDCAVRPSWGPASRLAKKVLSELSKGEDEAVRLYGASNHSESDILTYLSRRLPEESPLWESLIADPLPKHLLGSRGTWFCSACTSSLHALLAAVMDLSEENLDSDAIVFGSDALSALSVMGFSRVGATTKDKCRPFSEERDGILIGEGAAAVRLRYPCSDPKAIRILGFGMSCDAFHPTDPEPSGVWLERAIRDAIRRAGCSASDIAAVVGHGTGTLKSDLVEAAVYGRIWPGGEVPVTSIKGALGHTMGAAGLMNVLVAAQATTTGELPPTIGDGLSVIDGLDLVRGGPRKIKTSAPVIAVAIGFGGNNCACVIGAKCQ